MSDSKDRPELERRLHQARRMADASLDALTKERIEKLIKPSDRTPGIRGLVEAVGGKLVAAYMTTGANDIVIISEAPDGSDIAAVELAIVASGAIARVETVRAWTLPEFKEIMEKGGRVAAGFKPPGS